jgi:hypothetical protein
VDYDYLKSVEADGTALLGIAADNDLELPIPTCPGWTLADLMAHVAGAEAMGGQLRVVGTHGAGAHPAARPGGAPETIDAPLALHGVDEYAEEFLPLMLLGVAEPPPVTALMLSPTDIDDSRLLSLIPAGDDRDPGAAEVGFIASASEPLLWMWNRTPDAAVAVNGDDAAVTWWKRLAI